MKNQSRIIRQRISVIVGVFVCGLLPLLWLFSASEAARSFNLLRLTTSGAAIGTQTNITYDVAWGDVDNDGDLDLAIAESGSDGGAKLFLNISGTIASQPVWTGVGTASVAWGDVDNDGDLDLATGARFYLNENGVLADVHAWRSINGGSARDVAWGDINGDGQLDLVVGNRGNSRLYLNLGGTLDMTATWEIADGQNTESVALGDVDGDDDLDLVLGNGLPIQSGEQNRLYLNENGVLATTAAWVSAELEPTQSVAWGDVDNDGDLDLAVANWDVNGNTDFNRVYYNHNGTLETAASWTSDESDNTYAVAWGDANGDGWLDLVAGNFTDLSNNRVYLNLNGTLETSASWNSADADLTEAIAWGDVDGDGDLELVAGNDSLNKLYDNDTLGLATSGDEVDTVRAESVAWGDVDGDGDGDLAIGGISNVRLYSNENGTFAQVWSIGGEGMALAWGDVDGDGDPDLAVGSNRARLYLNTDGVLGATAAWESAENLTAGTLAWGDVDGDGNLDLAVGSQSVGGRVYLNQGNMLATTAAWQSADSVNTTWVAWGDVDGDNDLDLAVANDSFSANKIYFNEEGTLATNAGWQSTDADNSETLAWGDVDGDGDLDLAVGNYNGINRLYENIDGVLEGAANWTSAESDSTNCVAWGDADGDGDLDLAVGNGAGILGQLNRIHINRDGVLETTASWISAESEGTACLAWGDVDGDGRRDLVAANYDVPTRIYQNIQPAQLPNGASSGVRVDLGSADFYAQPTIYDDIVPIPFTLFQPDSQPSGHVRFFYSLNGGDNWRVAVPTTDTLTLGLAQSPTGTPHIFQWDTFASGFFGQSDNVVMRVEVAPNGSPTVGVPFPMQRPYVSAQSLPLRVRGTQVRVMQDGSPVANAILYRQPAGATTFSPFGVGETLFQTGQNGFLSGNGALQIGDRLIALLPVETTDEYVLYHTSASATGMGVESFEITNAGVQTLTVSAENPLMLFDLDISLEWAAYNDANYLNTFRSNLQNTSRILFDLSNGQVALGDVRVQFEREAWHTSDVIVFASNTMRPSADAGGIVSTFITDTHISNGAVITQAYLPGQVRMPATWERRGNPVVEQGDDWARAFAHELSHYLLFQLDNYLGVSPAGNLTLVDCKNSVMTHAYAVGYSEFANAANWTDDCLDTVAARTTGRDDWATITKFYPALFADRDNAGPTNLPLAVTEINYIEPENPINTLEDVFIAVRDETGALLATSSAAVEVVLVKTGNTTHPQDDHLIALGSPTDGEILLRGAAIGDRLCVYDNRFAERRAGCIDALTAASDSVTVQPLGEWNPRVSVIPPFSNTLNISVTQPNATALAVQVYPATLFSDTLVPTSITATLQPLGNGVFSQTVVLDAPSFRGHVRVWEPATGREALTNYYFGGGWGPTYVGWGPTYVGWGPTYVGWGPTYVGWGVNKIGWGIGRTGWNAPVQSANGQVSVFDMDNILGPTPPYILQSIATPPDLPSWLTPLGQAYQFISPIPFTGTHSILFNYLQRDVPGDTEAILQIYHQAAGETTWQPLPTELNAEHNFAATLLPDEGLFVLAATLEVPLPTVGRNQIIYPANTSRPITTALASIDGSYLSVYQQPNLSTWLFYDPAVLEPFQSLVNDLTEVQFGIYNIYVTEPVTLYVPVDAPTSRAASQQFNPPMVVYGWVTPTAGSPLGDAVTARVDGTLCGESTVQAVGDGFGYVVQVSADSSCQNGVVTITTADLSRQIDWNDGRAYFLPLSPAVPTAIAHSQLTAPSVGMSLLFVVLSGLLLGSMAYFALSKR